VETINDRSIIGAPSSSRNKANQTGGALLKKLPYVPRQYWDEICPVPTDEVSNMVKHKLTVHAPPCNRH
jgi:hypothetical protein